MSKNGRPIPTAVVVAGVIAALVIVIGVIIVVQMTKQAPDSTGAEPVRSTPAQPARQPADLEADSVRATWTERGEDPRVIRPELTAAEQETRARTGYAISGRVVDLGGNGVAQATVRAYLEPSINERNDTAARQVTTDEAGAFHLDNLPRRDLFLTASRGDQRFYLTSMPGQGQKGWCFPVLFLSGRDHVTGIRLTLRPTDAIVGTVVDIDDEPVANAVVTVWDIGTSAETDTQGCFWIAGLIPGRCWLQAEARGFLRVSFILASTASDDIVLRLERGVIVKGRAVLAESGAPVAGAKIRAVAKRNGGTEEVGTATADAEGNFEVLAHPECPTTLTARWESYVSDPERVVEVSEQEWWDPVTIELIKGGSITGVVRDKKTGLPAAGVSVGLESPTGEWMGADSDAEGAFSFDGLVAGPHVVSLHPFQPFGSAGAESEFRVEVVPGEAPAEVAFWVTPKATVTGTVVNAEGEPIFGAVVTQRVESGSATCFAQPTVTAADGRFLVRQTHWAITGLVVSHPDYCHTVADLEPGEDGEAVRDVRIVLEKGGGSIAGCVTGDGGAPIQHVRVDLLALDAKKTDNGQPPEVASTFTDEAGCYLFDMVAAGTYRVRATVYGNQFQSDDITLEAGQKMADVSLAIPASGHIAGRVTNADDEPVVGVEVKAYPRQSSGVSTTQTDADGRYRFNHLAEGHEYGISVNAMSKGYKRNTWRDVTCSADDEDFVLVRAETCTIRGSVYSRADGSPVPQFEIHVSTSKRTGRGSRSTSTKRYEFLTTDGSFECSGVEPGELSIAVSAPGFAEFTGEPFDLKAGEEAVRTIYLDAGAMIRGAVYRKSDRSPITAYRLWLLPQDPENAPNWFRLHRNGETIESDDGAFECPNVNPGTYTILIVTEGLPNHVTEPFEVASGGETVQKIYVGDGGIVRGTVVDDSGQPVADAVVSATINPSVKVGNSSVYSSDMGSPKVPDSATTDSAGRFELRGLSVGEVTTRAQHPEYAQGEADDITVTDEVPTEGVVIKLERGAVLYGWIKDLDGNPLKGDTLAIYASLYCTADLDENGQYRSPRLPSGTYKLRLGYQDAILPEVTVEGEQDTELNIDFTQAGSISGKVNLPSQPEDVTVRLILRGLDELHGSRSVNAADDGTFEFKGVFEGKYKLEISARSAIDRDTTYVVTTSPREIAVNVGPKKDVKQDVSVVDVKEFEHH